MLKTTSIKRLVQTSFRGYSNLVVKSEVIKSQAPNRLNTWSNSQAVKEEVMTGARFEQTNLETQPNPLAAIELINQVEVIKVEGRVVACDGGGGALGHPKVYLNLVLAL